MFVYQRVWWTYSGKLWKVEEKTHSSKGAWSFDFQPLTSVAGHVTHLCSFWEKNTCFCDPHGSKDTEWRDQIFMLDAQLLTANRWSSSARLDWRMGGGHRCHRQKLLVDIWLAYTSMNKPSSIILPERLNTTLASPLGLCVKYDVAK